ncbi:MAG: HyaD/HybD family hydrogenase maturation endopeptidase [Gammaproteobacteria bacterium]|nr:HyaD/HybD family hydrogenase maturation endopeptidase [Gammaproteobacteria bacterium]
MNTEKTICVLGIGNVLWADEGFGVRCVEALEQHYDFTPSVQLIDGGTQGMYLLDYVQSSTHLIIIDAIDYGLPAGTVKVVENDEVPRFMGVKKMSLHQTGFQEVLQISQLTGKYPNHLVLIGCQPEKLEDYGGSLTDTVKQSMPHALALAKKQLEQWGVTLSPKDTRNDNKVMMQSPELALDSYEQQRPDEQSAYRYGDSRFLTKEV